VTSDNHDATVGRCASGQVSKCCKESDDKCDIFIIFPEDKPGSSFMTSTPLVVIRAYQSGLRGAADLWYSPTAREGTAQLYKSINDTMERMAKKIEGGDD